MIPRPLLAAVVFPFTASALTLPVSEDTSTTTSAKIAKVAGKATTLPVTATRCALVRFEVGAFAGDISSADVTRARLILYVGKASQQGDLTVRAVTSDWSEVFTAPLTVPTVDPSAITVIPLAQIVSKQFVIADVTAQVKAWLDAPASDFGFAITAGGITNVLLGAKEGSASGYPAVLEIEADEPIASLDATVLVDGSVTSAKLAPNLLLAGTTMGTFSGDGSGLTNLANLNASSLTSGTVPASVLGNAWGIGGNAGTTAGVHFLGTTDTPSLDLRVNNQSALRLTYAQQAVGIFGVNVIGGFGGNSVSNGVYGATIGGGGDASAHNVVVSLFGTVGGGAGNTAGFGATVSGGISNTASGSDAVVPGGESNTAAGTNSFAAGFRGKANHNGVFVWADLSNPGADFNSTGPNQFLIRANGGVGIGTNSPGAALDVAGNIKASAVEFAAPITRHVAIPAPAFQDRGSICDGIKVYPGGVGLAKLFAEVTLPDGATITAFEARLLDNTTEGNITVSLISAGTDDAPNVVATIGTSGAPLATVQTLGVPVNEQVHNMNRRYFIEAAWSNVDGTPNADLRSVQITYTITEPLP